MNTKLPKAILSDIDGTISDRRHRLHFIEGKKDWDAFFESLIDDPVIQTTVDKISEILIDDVELIFVTGRPEKYRSLTEDWITKNTPFKKYELYMRRNKDFRKDVIIKKEMLDDINMSYEVSLVFEDQQQLCDMWSGEGLECFKIEQ